MTVIAVDGFNVKPKKVNSIFVGPGSRVDFILNATQDVGNYRINVQTLNGDSAPVILKYKGADDDPTMEQTSFESGAMNMWYGGGGSNALGNTSFVPEGSVELNLGLYPHMLEPMEPVTLPSSNGTFTTVNVTANGADFMEWDKTSPSFIEGTPYVWFFKINDGPFQTWVLPKYPPVYWQHENIDPNWAINQAAGNVSFEYSEVPGMKDVATYRVPYVSAELGETLRVIVNNPTKMAHPVRK